MTAPPLDTVEITEPGVYPGIPDAVYHADPVPGRSLSVTGAKKLLPPSCPKRFAWERDNPPEPTDDFDIGHAAHKLALGVGPQITVVDAPDWRGTAAKEARAAAREDGAVPLLRPVYEQVVAMADALRQHPLANALLSDGTPEASMFWTDEETGVWCRGRVDWLPSQRSRSGRLVIPDYKTARSAEPEQFAKAAADYGYHQQDAWYRAGVKALGLDDDPAFVFIVQEKQPPYLVSVVQLDVQAVRIGAYLNRLALDTYAQCERSGVWPSYTDDVAHISLPFWYEKRFEADL